MSSHDGSGVTNPKRPRVSVVMSVYNDGPFIEEAVKSILNQTFGDFEFIIVDDGVVDDSIVKVLQFSDPRIRLIRQANGGLPVALNRALHEAKAEIIARQDGDDVSDPQRLERLVQFLDEHPSVGLVGSAISIIDEQGRLIRVTQYPERNSDLQEALINGDANPFAHGSVVFRRLTAAKAGMYRPQFRCEDFDLWLRIAEIAEVANLPDVLYAWRLRRGSLSLMKSESYFNSVRLARWCARVRRQGKSEPEFNVDLITRKWFVALMRPLRVPRDAQLAESVVFAQQMLFDGKQNEARPLLKEAVSKSPTTVYLWLLLTLSFLPTGTARALWSIVRRVYRFGTWRR